MFSETVMEHLRALSCLWDTGACMLFSKVLKKTQISCLFSSDTYCIERCDVVRRGRVGVLVMGWFAKWISQLSESPFFLSFFLSLLLLNAALSQIYFIRDNWAGRCSCKIQDWYSDLLASNLLRLPSILTWVFVVFPQSFMSCYRRSILRYIMIVFRS